MNAQAIITMTIAGSELAKLDEDSNHRRERLASIEREANLLREELGAIAARRNELKREIGLILAEATNAPKVHGPASLIPSAASTAIDVRAGTLRTTFKYE